MTSARGLGLRLSEQIDLAARLHADASMSLGELRDREAEFVRRKRAAGSDAALITSWLDFVYAGKKRPGQLYVNGARIAAAGVVVVGLVTGWSTAKLVLRYDGRTPVNVVEFLGVLVLLQIVLLAFLLLGLVWRQVAGKREGDVTRRPVGIVQTVLRYLLDAKSRAELAAGAPARSEAWLLLLLTQIFGVSFNLAALVSTLYLVSFTDLAFAWSTTLDVSAEAFHRWISALAVPFRFLGEGLVPSLDVVRETQYFRFDERYAAAREAMRATDVRLLGAWWPFLVLSLVTYGLLPRLIMFALAATGLRRSVARPEFNELEVENLVVRLRDALQPPARRSADAERRSVTPPTTITQLPTEVPQVAVLWRDVAADEALVRRSLCEVTGKEPIGVLRAGGAAFDLQGERAAASVRELRQKGRVRVLVLVEDGEHADAALTGFLHGLRARLGAEVLLLVVPVRARGGELTIAKDALIVDRWRRQLQQATGDIVAVYERSAGS